MRSTNIQLVLPFTLDDFMNERDENDISLQAPCSLSGINIDKKYLAQHVVPFVFEKYEWKNFMGFKRHTIFTKLKTWSIKKSRDGISYMILSYKVDGIPQEHSLRKIEKIVRKVVRRGILDGWGESEMQAGRFGPTCYFDEVNSKWTLNKVPGYDYSEKRFALLVTLNSCEIRIRTHQD